MRDVLEQIYTDQAYETEKPAPPDIARLIHLADDVFVKEISTLCYAFRSEELFSDQDYRIIAQDEDTTATSRFYGTERRSYQYDCFEILYVYQGTCEFIFQKEIRTLKQGDFCIVTPFTFHEFYPLTPDSFLCPILVKPETFQQTFFSLLSDKDVLSLFFHHVLSSHEEPNYLLFQTESSYQVNLLMREIFLEHFQYDSYANRNAISWLNLIFTYVLRNYQTYFQFCFSCRITHLIHIFPCTRSMRRIT